MQTTSGDDGRQRPHPCVTVSDGLRIWADAKRDQEIIGELSPRTLADYLNVAGLCSDLMGSMPVCRVTPGDWLAFRSLLAVRWGKVRVGNAVTWIRSAFRWLDEAGAICRPMRFGPDFRKPRRRRSDRSSLIWTPEEIAAMLAEANDRMRACILLGLNAGLGNTDCAALHPTDVRDGFVRTERAKTGLPRAFALWPETAAALATAGLPMLTRNGLPVSRFRCDLVAKDFAGLAGRCGVHRPGRGFYSLRRTYRTAVDGHWDRHAIDLTMGHATPGSGRLYVLTIGDDRLIAVAQIARRKLLPGLDQAGDAVRVDPPRRAVGDPGRDVDPGQRAQLDHLADGLAGDGEAVGDLGDGE
jgi:integrase